MQSILIPHRIAAGMPPAGKLRSFNGLTMGTTWSVKIVADDSVDAADLHDGMQRQLDRVVGQMSHWQQDSDLCRFNRAEPGSWHELPPEFFEVLSYALSVAQESDGAYDPAAGALVNIWGFGPVNRYDEPGFSAPGNDVVRSVLNLPGWRQIALEKAACRARQPGGALLDFSAVAKGYAVDRLASYLEQQGIRDYLVEVGGELCGAGMKPDGQPWWVELEQPPHDNFMETSHKDGILLALHGLSVATSGDYRRCFHQEGKRFSHTLDPRTGHPVHNGIASVTVVHESCMAADALSTALTVLGVEKGMCFAEARCLAVRFVIRQGDGFIDCASSSFLEMLQ